MTLETMIANYQTAAQTVNDLAILWDNPACGVPGFGFKAARKAQPTRIAAGVKLAQAQFALRNYVRDTKASQDRRAKRLAAIQRMIPHFILD